MGILLPLIGSTPLAESDSAHYAIMQAPYAEKINGINLSPLGTGCDCKVNGLNVYGVGSIIRQVNGISASLVMILLKFKMEFREAYFLTIHIA